MRSIVSLLAKTSRLLIASDFDGTLAPIVNHPDQAAAPTEILELLRRAAALPQTNVAIVSGRSLSDLRARIGDIKHAWFVGGHGAEISGPRLEHVPDDVSLLLESISEPLRQAAPASLGFVHERKPTSIAVHYRHVAPANAETVVKNIIENIASPARLAIRHGKKVIELLGVDVDKGRAVAKLQFATGSTGTFYMGDDVTDEDAFGALGDHDISVKVGEVPTKADFCVPGLAEAHALLTELVEHREQWLRSVHRSPLQDHSVLSDQRTLAVISPEGRVVWLCVPRVDSGAVFAELLDGPEVGVWSIAPATSDHAPPTQRYVGDTFTLETSWETFRVIDYLDGSAGRTFQRPGRTDLIRVIEGRGEVIITFAPRLDFGRAKTRLNVIDSGIMIEGAADPMVLRAPGVIWAIEDGPNGQTAVAKVELDGSPLVLELRAGTRSLASSPVPEPARREQTGHIWRSWAASLKLPIIAPELCRRSALLLRALVYGPSGALLAAGTTSLPELAGGARNWDYRFCWPRDAAVACASLVRLGNTGVAMRYLDWLLGIVDSCAGPEQLRPIYHVSGHELGPEAELSHLNGYRTSKPVRIGNAAARQVQLDVFGPIVELVYLLANAGAAISPDHWRLVEAMAIAVERCWDQPDHGIWEIRADCQHHVHSKTMCWLALDRAVKLAEQFVGVRREGWDVLRDRIRNDVLANGFSAKLSAFTAAYGVEEPDASALSVGLSGMLEASDTRFASTVDLVQRRLLDVNTVYRYRYDDGLPGPEGGFHICTGWLIESLAMVGRRQEAHELFDQYCRASGQTGVLTEEWCPVEQSGLGNLPQAYSHSALINAAFRLSSE